MCDRDPLEPKSCRRLSRPDVRRAVGRGLEEFAEYCEPTALQGNEPRWGCRAGSESMVRR